MAADKKDRAPSPATQQRKTSSDKDGTAGSKPLEKVDVSVDSRPRPGGNYDHSIKIDKAAAGEIKQAIKEAAPGGAKKQFEAAQKTAEKVAQERVDPKLFEEVRVKVSGTSDGRRMERNFIVKIPEPKAPAQPAPAAPAPAKK